LKTVKWETSKDPDFFKNLC